MKHRSLIAVAAVGTLILASCGDDDDDATDSVAIEATAAGADAAPTTTIAAAAADTTEAAAGAVTSEAAAGAVTTEAGVATTEAGVAVTAEAALGAETTAAEVATTEGVGVAVASTEATAIPAPGAATTETLVFTPETAVTTEAVTTDAVTTEAAVTTEGVTAAAVTTDAVTTEAVTTEAVTTEAVTTEAVTTEAVTTEAVTTEAVTTEAVTTEAVTTEAVTTDAVTTEAVTTEAVTTEAVPTEAVTTEPVTTEPVTTEAVTTEAVTTEAAMTTDAAVTTEAVESTEAITAAAITTEAVTTEAVTTEAVATTEAAVTTEAVESTEAITAAAITTEAVTTEAVTTEAVATTEAATTTEAIAAVATSEAGAATSVPESSLPTASSVPVEAVGTGPECAELPNFGEGALSELADDTAGTAITNNLETSTLQQLLGDAELLETLEGEGPFTVFAPVNGAFVELPPEQRAALTADPAVLAEVLSFHVVEGESLSSDDLAREGSVVSLEGEELNFTLEADVLTINDEAAAVCGDIPIANGTLYLIDATLVPPSAADDLAPATTAVATETSAAADGATATTEAGADDGTITDGSEPAGATTEAGGESASGVVFPVSPGPDWPATLVFTLTPSQEASGLIETAQPLADALSDRLGVDVEARVPNDYAGVIAALDSGQAHIAGGLGAVQMVQAADEADAELILQSERSGELVYVTQWFTNDPDTYCGDEPVADEDGFLSCNGVGDATSSSDGPIGEEHLSDVAGETVAFTDQGSASGHLVPSLQLLNAGVDPVEDITPLFAGGHDGAVQAVYDGDAAVGVSFNDARGLLVEQFPDVGEQLVVFAWSFPIPNDGWAVGGDLPPDLQEAISAAMLDIAGTPDGQAMLQELYQIDGLVPVDSADYDVIRELRTELADLLE